MRNLNLTPRAQKLIKEAHFLAVELGHAEIDHLHFFVSFLSMRKNQIHEAFESFKIDTPELKERAKLFLTDGYEGKPINKKSLKAILSPSGKSLFDYAKQLSTKYDHKYVGLEHVFLCLFESPDDLFLTFLDAQDINFDAIIDYVERKFEEDDLITTPAEEEAPKEKQIPSNQFDPNKYKLLNSYATNLNKQVSAGKINSLHLNKELIQKISEVLCRKNKNNPLIVGEAGVGKTALVESLAQAIVENQCSDFLMMKNIYSLDIPMIIAGCKYRGEFEEKIKNLLKEIVNDHYIVLFIDEIHTIIGAGNPENGMDVANILKPYLARGEITCIGATTFDEYKRTIADDPALSRRFQMVKLEEPSKEQVFSLIKNIKNSYENFHLINFTDETIKYTIDCAEKYIEGRFPDKALDVVDQVGAKSKLRSFSKSKQMLAVEVRLNKLASKHGKMPSEEYTKNLHSLLKKYQEATEKMINKWKNSKHKVTKDDILEVVSDKTNIPIEDLKQQDSEKVINLKKSLSDQVFGQNQQIEQIYKCLLRAKAGFRNKNKPTASLLFAGPTGVGKTMTGKILAEKLFVNKNNFVFIDLSEYSDKTAVNKLLGSNPGYIGFDKGGILTEKVKRNPYSLILFDEVQKAHEDVLFSLLQILEEGKISDSSGKVVDFSNTIIVMTTNVGSQAVMHTPIGFVNEKQSVKNDVVAAVKKHFPADLLNRIDEIIAFEPLSEKDINLIIEKQLISFKKELSERDIEFEFDEELNKFILSKIQFNNFGARQVIKTIQREIQTIIAEKILENPEIKDVKICIENHKICVI